MLETLSKINTAIKLETTDYKKLYREMLLIRRFEEKAGNLYKKGEIAGFCHLYIGQEALVTGVQSQLQDNDVVITTYRDHGHMLACGMNPNGVMAELTGRSGGFSKGKGGSMHMFSVEKGFYGGHGIVGASVPIGAGLGFAQKYNNTGGISVTYFGDGAVNQGQVYEAFNMASLWKLPVLFIIEDNGYSIGTSKKRHAAGGELYKRAEPFGIPGKHGDGMDIDEVISLAKWGIDHVRSGNGPAIIQFDTYRYRGHSMSDSTKSYRSKEEEAKTNETRDCLDQVFKKGNITKEEIQELEEEIKILVQEAEKFALESPLQDESELYTDVYKDSK